MTTDEIEIAKVLDELYDIVSGPAGPRDWSRQRSIFHEDSRQMRTWIDTEGKAQPVYPWNPKDGWGTRPSEEAPMAGLELPTTARRRPALKPSSFLIMGGPVRTVSRAS